MIYRQQYFVSSNSVRNHTREGTNRTNAYFVDLSQEPITRSELLPYYAFVKAFLRTRLFLDAF